MNENQKILIFRVFLAYKAQNKILQATEIRWVRIEKLIWLTTEFNGKIYLSFWNMIQKINYRQPSLLRLKVDMILPPKIKLGH